MVENTQAWTPAGPDVAATYAAWPDPLASLARAEIPAVLLPQVYPVEHCRGLVERFVERELMRDPNQALPEGGRTRTDIGASLGNLGNDRERFFARAEWTRSLFQQLFEGFIDPVATIYHYLQALAGGKVVKTAEEPDGRQYGPAIFRIHYTSHAYRPHIDHVTLREKRFDYAVSRFEHQFAGVLCLQNAALDGQSVQAVLHRCLWTPQVQPHMAEGFYQYAADHQVENYRVELEPGDLYFF